MKKCTIMAAVLVAALAAMLSACDDGKSYAELLGEEDMYVNNFLSDQRVCLEVPEDSVFECGVDAPFYRIDEDGMMYMQVVNPGTEGNKVSDNEQIYFRYTRYALAAYKNGELPKGEGNHVTLNPCWFRYNNYIIESSYTWGTGVQTPLSFLSVDCEVNIVIKSTMGPTAEQAEVRPYLWHLTYERRQ